MRSRHVPIASILLLLLVLFGAGCQASALRSTASDQFSAIDIADFTLPDQFGQPYTLSQQRGDAVLVFFGYTNCPDECPTTLGDFKRVQAQLKEDASRGQFLFITTDPERDTAEVLQRYMAQFDTSFRALRSEGESMEVVKVAFGAVGEKKGGLGAEDAYSMFHTSYIYLVGPTGRLEKVYPYGTSPETMTRDIRLLLK